jgi:4-hydroxy-2-oxoheptanedioate aldolase
MINTAEDARRLVQATRYAPMGGRSFGPTRANLVHGSGYAKGANASVLVLAMIETREALQNLDAILAVEGIDGVYVGPSDLGLSLGHEPTLEPTAPEVLDAIAEILSRARAAGRIAGVHTGSPEMVNRMLVLGFHFASLLTDMRIFVNSLAAQLAETRGGKVRDVKGY